MSKRTAKLPENEITRVGDCVDLDRIGLYTEKIVLFVPMQIPIGRMVFSGDVFRDESAGRINRRNETTIRTRTLDRIPVMKGRAKPCFRFGNDCGSLEPNDIVAGNMAWAIC